MEQPVYPRPSPDSQSRERTSAYSFLLWPVHRWVQGLRQAWRGMLRQDQESSVQPVYGVVMLNPPPQESPPED